MRPVTRRALLAGLAALPVAGALAACDGGLGQPQASGGDQLGFVNGDGTVKILSVAERGDAVELSGETTHGDTVDVAAWRGQLVVINVWYATCAPCRIEAPELARIAADTPDVQFLGINTSDGIAQAQSFEREFSIPYPSLLDAGSGQGLLALRGQIPPQAVPSTVVLDAEGRPAARVIGRVAEDVLRGMIDEVRKSSA